MSAAPEVTAAQRVGAAQETIAAPGVQLIQITSLGACSFRHVVYKQKLVVFSISLYMINQSPSLILRCFAAQSIGVFFV